MIKRVWAYLLAAVLTAALAIPAVAADSRMARCNVRLRKQASTSSDTLVTIPGGTELPVLGSSGGWVKTSYKGHTGYAYSDLLTEMTQTGYYPLKEGDENPYVTELQKRLIELGYMTGSANGKFGETTLAAVKQFQKDNKIKQDGIAGGETQRAIFSDSAKTATGSAVSTGGSGGSGTETSSGGTSTATASASTLKLGDRGNDVQTLQARLIELGYLSGKADGVFGKDTEKAIIAFQKRSSLTADGKAGKVTQNMLYSSSAKAAEGVSVAAQSAAASSGAESTYKTLKRGMTSNDVKNLQNALKQLGYFAAGATGYYGSETQGAVEKFQKANNLTADGVAGNATQQLLYSANAKASSGNTSTGVTTSYATLKEGMKSSAVTTMQKKLINLGYLSASATGYYGSATKKAVSDFQKANNLKSDGIAGSATLTLLYGDNAASSGGSNSSGTPSSPGKISGPSASSVKLLHWFQNVKPSLKSSSVVQVYDPVSGYGFKLKALSLGRHFDSEPLTADDTLYMIAAFGGVTTWTPKTVWVQLPSGTWTLATMHNTPHLSGSVKNNNFDGHLCVHFLRDMDECAKNDPNYGVQHQKAIREAWKKLTGETVN